MQALRGGSVPAFPSPQTLLAELSRRLAPHAPHRLPTLCGCVRLASEPRAFALVRWRLRVSHNAPVSPLRPFVGPHPGGSPPAREPPWTPAVVYSGCPSLETQEYKQDIFGKRDSHPVQSGNTASGRSVRSEKPTESHHLCHETWLTLSEDLVPPLSPPCSPQRVRPRCRRGGRRGLGRPRVFAGRLRTGARAGLQCVCEPAPGSAPPGGHRPGREGHRRGLGSGLSRLPGNRSLSPSLCFMTSTAVLSPTAQSRGPHPVTFHILPWSIPFLASGVPPAAAPCAAPPASLLISWTPRGSHTDRPQSTLASVGWLICDRGHQTPSAWPLWEAQRPPCRPLTAPGGSSVPPPKATRTIFTRVKTSGCVCHEHPGGERVRASSRPWGSLSASVSQDAALGRGALADARKCTWTLAAGRLFKGAPPRRLSGWTLVVRASAPALGVYVLS